MHEVDGHDADALADDDRRGSTPTDGPPHVLVARTIFGKGVSYMERQIKWHYWPMSDDEYRAARIAELERGAMRGAFVRTLVRARRRRTDRVVLLTGDLGFMVLEPFAERFPDRFFNVGVAEQNMVGIATGLAEAGFIPFVYSIATFATLRPYEFIRNGPVLHRLPVRIVGVGGGFEYGPQGSRTTALEDVGVMRVQPGMTVVAPADHRADGDARCAPPGTCPGRSTTGSARTTARRCPGLDGRFALGPARDRSATGDDVVLVAMGSVASEAVAAADALAAQRRARRACSSSRACSPAPDRRPRRPRSRACRWPSPSRRTTSTGGLGSLVAEVIAEHGLGCRLVRCGVRTRPDGVSGSQRYLHDAHGLSRRALVEDAVAQPGSRAR